MDPPEEPMNKFIRWSHDSSEGQTSGTAAERALEDCRVGSPSGMRRAGGRSRWRHLDLCVDSHRGSWLSGWLSGLPLPPAR